MKIQIYSLPDPGSGFPKAIFDTLKRDWTVGYMTQNMIKPLTAALPKIIDLAHVMVRTTAAGDLMAVGKGSVNADGYLFALVESPRVKTRAYFLFLN